MRNRVVRKLHGGMWLWAVAVFLLLPLAAACARSTPAPEPVTIRFTYSDADTAAFEKLAASFKESHPNVTVELQGRNGGALNRVDPAETDVFVNTNLNLSGLLDAGKVMSLDSWIEGDETFNPDDFYPGTIQLFSSQGKTWAIPAGVDPFVMYYNQDLFDQASLAYPTETWTWDDFLQAAFKLTDPDNGRYGYVSRSVADPALFVYQHGGQLLDDWQNPTRTTFDAPLTIEALEWWDSLANGEHVAPTPAEVRGLMGVEPAIYAGRIGMWFGQLSERGGASWSPQTEWMMKWGVAPLPRDQEAVTIATSDGYFIFSQLPAADAQACWEWISFLSTEAPGRLAPVRKSVLASETYSRQVGTGVASVARTAIAQAMLIQPIDIGPFESAIDDISNGRATIQEAMTRAQQTIK